MIMYTTSNMMRKLRRRYGTITLVLFGLVGILQVAIIAHSLDRPMWLDEAWRPTFIARNFDIPIADRDTYAPISFGMYAITKFLTLFADNNFIQRLVTYVAFLVLPFVVYKFATVFLDRTTARVLIPVSVLSGYVLEFSTQNKPYIMDIVVTLLLMLAYHYYVHKQLQSRYFIAASMAGVLFSFAAFFALACFGLHALYALYKEPTKKRARNLLAWLVPVTAVSLAHLVLFIRPQLNPSLHGYYDALYPSGRAFEVLGSTFENLLTMFGIFIGKPLISPGSETYPAFWNTPQLELAGKPVLGLAELLAWAYLAVFIYGLYRLLKQKKRVIPAMLGGMLAVQWVAALFERWPFGHARTNLFTTFLVTVIICYGAIELWRYLTQYRHLKLVTATVFVVITILVFPYKVVGAAVSGPSTGPTTFATNAGIRYGVEPGARIIAAQSQPSDIVAVDYYVGPFGFEYFYGISDYVKPYSATKAQRVLYMYQKRQQFPTSQILQAKPNAVWLVLSSEIDHGVVAKLREHNYYLTYKHTEGDVLVIRLARDSAP